MLDASRPYPSFFLINVDENEAYPKTIADLKAAEIVPVSVELRQKEFFNNLIRQVLRCIQHFFVNGWSNQE